MLKNYVLRALALTGLCAAAFAQPASSQVNTYSFAASAGTYATLPATATAAATVQTDEGLSAVLPLGFSFVFDGTSYTQAVASSNGFLSFGPGVVAGPGNSLNAGAAGLRPLAAPLWDDLSGNAFNARASYQTTGTAPNRVFTFEWLNWKWNRLAPAVGISFQVQLFEGTNAVAFVYRPEAGALNVPTASIGLAGVGSGSGSYLSVLDSGGSPTASSTLENASIDTAPAAGQTYTFTPGAAVCTAPRSLATSNITGTGATVTFAGSAAAVGYVVTYTAAGGSPVTVSPNPTASPVVLTGLMPGTSYTVTVASDCGGGTITAATTATFSTPSYCVANLGGGGCAATDLISAVSIAGTALNNSTNNCQTANGSSYSAFPATGSTTATLTSGAGAYTLSVTSTANSASGFWIDYDQNNVFDASEFTRISGGVRPGQAATVAFSVPATAVQGPTKMRIRTRTITGGPGGAGVAATDACSNFTTGETEDYVVTIGAPAACPAPSNLATSNLTSGGVTLTFGGTAAGYTVGLTPQGGTTQTTTAPASPVALSGLAPGTVYTVAVTANCTGGSSSAPATLTFTTPAVAPANNDCAAAVAVPVTADCSSPTPGTVLGATQSLPPGNNCGVPSQNAFDVWFSFVATATSQLVTVTPAFNAIVDIRRGGCAASASVNCGVALAGTATGRVGAGLTVGATYLVRVYPAGPPPAAAAAGLSICVTAVPAPPANDDCAAATNLPVTPDCTAPTAGTVASATQSLAPTANCGGGGPPLPNAFDVWYNFTATAATHVLTLAPQFNAVVDVRGGTCAASTSLSCAQVGTGTTISRLLTGLTAGTAYFVRVYPLALAAPTGAGAAFTLCLTNAPVLPANDDCAAAIGVPVTADCSNPTVGTIAAATQSLAPTPNCGRNVATAPDVWYSFVATAATHVVQVAAQFDGIVDVRSGPCTTSASLVCNTVAPNNPRTFPVNALVVGSTYFVRLYPAAGAPVGASASFQLCITTVPVVPTNDDPCGALSLNTGLVASTTAGATTTALPGINQPTCSGATNPRDVWFSFVAPNSTMLLNFGGNSASVARLYTAATCSTGFNLFGCRRSANGVALGMQTISGLTVGTTYYVAVSGFANNSLTGAISVSFVVLGTRGRADAQALLVYPNPSNTGQLTLRLAPQATAGTAALLNVLGQAVATLPLPAHTAETTLPVRGLAAGLYTLRVVVDGQVLTRKVVLE